MPGSPAQTGYAASPGTFPFWTGPTGAVTAGQVLYEFPFPFSAGRISGLEFNAVTAGSGTGNTQLDVLINGVSIWAGQLTNRPSLPVASTGRFTQVRPVTTLLRYGDIVTVSVSTIPTTTGHARISGSLAVEKQ